MVRIELTLLVAVDGLRRRHFLPGASRAPWRTSGHTSAASVAATSTSTASQNSRRGSSAVRERARACTVALEGEANYTGGPCGRPRSASGSVQLAGASASAIDDWPGQAPPMRKCHAPDKDIREASLEYHRRVAARQDRARCRPSSSPISATLALAYSPGVAAACDEIVRDPREASTLTARVNLVGVRDQRHRRARPRDAIGPLAAKPVMEGKAVLFKKFAGLDCFDIEIDERDPDKLVDMIVRARADVRRHQSRGHQGARVLLHRAQVSRADEDPGLPRRPARHGDHRRRRGAERPARRRQGVRETSSSSAPARAPRRSRASISSSRSASAARTSAVSDIKGVVYAGRTEEMDDNKVRLRAADVGAHARRNPAGRRHLPRASRPRAC